MFSLYMYHVPHVDNFGTWPYYVLVRKKRSSRICPPFPHPTLLPAFCEPAKSWSWDPPFHTVFAQKKADILKSTLSRAPKVAFAQGIPAGGKKAPQEKKAPHLGRKGDSTGSIERALVSSASFELVACSTFEGMCVRPTVSLTACSELSSYIFFGGKPFRPPTQNDRHGGCLHAADRIGGWYAPP